MSINKQQIIHIVSELVIITGISIYFNSKVKKLANYIETLENKIIQQEQVIQNHEQLLLRLMNNFEIMNVNVSNIQKSFQQNNNNEENIKAKTKLKNNKKNKSSSSSDDKKEEELLKNTTPSLQTIFSHNIPNEQIFIMEMPINPINMMNMNKEQIIQSDKVEEVIDDDEFLDKEIENELKELDDLGEDNNDKNDEDVDDDDVEENVGDDEDE
jgi:hypothetical protein